MAARLIIASVLMYNVAGVWFSPYIGSPMQRLGGYRHRMSVRHHRSPEEAAKARLFPDYKPGGKRLLTTEDFERHDLTYFSQRRPSRNMPVPPFTAGPGPASEIVSDRPLGTTGYIDYRALEGDDAPIAPLAKSDLTFGPQPS
mmetsp:Transcript_17629/g.26416  ORF Transcript_17629/g.26416 Transcript_17629/m.26416 type:complete len:143 (+) Transcript_17629:33-461(+)